MQFSIIVPVYNVENYISECIDSILKQTFTSFEIIIVNDGSTDDSLKICKEYEKYDSVNIIDKPNGGLSSARNEGLKCAKGDYIIFLDSDDFIKNDDFLAKVKKECDKESDLILIGVTKYYSETDFESRYIPKLEGKSKKDLLTQLMNENEFTSSACTKIYRNELIGKARFVEDIHSEDIEWSLFLLMKAEKITSIPELTYYYRQSRVGSITTKFTSNDFLNYIDILDRSVEMIKSSNDILFELYYKYLNYQYLILIGYSYCFIKNNKDNLAKLRKYKLLLNYHSTFSTKILNILSKLLGLRLISYLLMFKIRKKGISIYVT